MFYEGGDVIYNVVVKYQGQNWKSSCFLSNQQKHYLVENENKRSNENNKIPSVYPLLQDL